MPTKTKDNLQEPLVDKDLAILLKEVGFDMPVRNNYTLTLGREDRTYESPTSNNWNENGRIGIPEIWHVSRPTLAQAQIWLREMKGIFVQPTINHYEHWVEVEIFLKDETPKINSKKYKCILSGDYFAFINYDWDGALEAGIKYAVTYLLGKTELI